MGEEKEQGEHEKNEMVFPSPTQLFVENPKRMMRFFPLFF